jgi:hypothetical protein
MNVSTFSQKLDEIRSVNTEIHKQEKKHDIILEELCERIYRHIVFAKSSRDFFDLTPLIRTYTMPALEKPLEDVIKRLNDSKFNTRKSYGNTALFIFPEGEAIPDNCY